MYKKLFIQFLVALTLGFVSLTIAIYFKFDTFMSFLTGSITYWLYDIITDIKIKVIKERV